MANYPTSASTDASLHVAVNSLATAIVGALTPTGGNNGSDIEVVSTANFPSAGFITVDTEAIQYTSLLSGPPRFSGITRGADGTIAASHAGGTAAKHNVIAAHHNATKDEVVAVTTDLVAAHGTLNDADTPAATATDIKDRLDHIVTQLKRIIGGTNWYDSLSASLKNIAVDTFVGVGRNRIYNGALRFDEINNGASADASHGVSVSGPNRMYLVVTNSTAVVRIATHVDTPPDDFSHYMRFTCITADASIAAGDQVFFDRNLEGLFTADFNSGTSAAKTVTFSFYVRSPLTGTYTGVMANHNQDRSYPFEYTINSADTWERKTITLTMDTTGTWVDDTNIGVRIRMALAIGSTYQGTANTWQAGQFLGTANQVNFVSSNTSRTIDFTGFQLEVGSVATPFEHTPYHLDRAIARRYYERKTFYAVGWITTASEIQTGVNFIQKRVTPTTTAPASSITTRYGPGGQQTASSVTFGDTTDQSVRVIAGNGGGMTINASGHVFGTIILDARLS